MYSLFIRRKDTCQVFLCFLCFCLWKKEWNLPYFATYTRRAQSMVCTTTTTHLKQLPSLACRFMVPPQPPQSTLSPPPSNLSKHTNSACPINSDSTSPLYRILQVGNCMTDLFADTKVSCETEEEMLLLFMKRIFVWIPRHCNTDVTH